MAYRKPYNPDELPQFAEPEPKPGAASTSPSRYETKPPPPVPRTDSAHYGGHRNSEHRDGRRPPAGYDNARMSPPAAGGGKRPSTHGRPPNTSRLPPSPAPEVGVIAGDSNNLVDIFNAVDKGRSGQLTERELGEALINSDWTSFDPQTVRMMIRMFDSDRSGSIGFNEFCGLWSFLSSWRTLFDRFDVDKSGTISLDEFSNALEAFRYRLSPGFVELLFRTYDKRGVGSMSFDLFVQSCISLKRMTDVFKRYDEDRDGYITLSFEDFLAEILKQLR